MSQVESRLPSSTRRRIGSTVPTGGWSVVCKNGPGIQNLSLVDPAKERGVAMILRDRRTGKVPI